MPKPLRLVFALLLLAGLVSLRAPDPIRFRVGDQTYEWVSGWGRLADGKTLGNTHGCIVVDRQDRVYLNTDTEDAVVVFDADGKVVETWGKDLAGGLHGMALFDEGGEQRLLLTHLGRRAAEGEEPPGGQVLCTTLHGEILWSVGYPAEAGIYKKPGQYRPTSVAPLADGGFLVADGYGASFIHRYDAQHRYVSSFGGPGSELGQLKTPHGIWIETRGETPVLLVADRENNRLQVFDLEGHALREVKDVEHDLLRRPCHMHPFGDTLVVADLAGRITFLDRDLGLIAHAGDNPDPRLRARNDVPPEYWHDGEFLAPHCANWDSAGNVYVTDWVSTGRISKLRRVRE